MKIEAMLNDTEVHYPTDINLLYKLSNLHHPTTFRKQIRRVYLEVIKQKKSRKFTLVNITYLGRDIYSFIGLIVVDGSQLLYWLKLCQQRTLRAIITMYHQQNSMFKQRTHTYVNSIIYIFQPHIRPIARGKAKSN